MRVRAETGASIEDLRRLAGWPDISPLQELASLTFEQCLVSQMSAALRELRASGRLSEQGLGSWPDLRDGGRRG